MGLQSSGDKSCTWDWMVIMSSSGESRGWQPLEEVKRWKQKWFDKPDPWEERLRIGCHPTNYGFCHAHIVGPHPNEVNIGNLAIKIVHTIFALMYKFGFHFEMTTMGGQHCTIPGKILFQINLSH